MPLRLHILEIDSALEAQAIRAIAECLGISVSVTWVANSKQVVDFLSQTPPHELIFICGHGDEHGLLLPSLADEVKSQFPFNDVLTPADLSSFLRLNGNVVVSTGCASGTEKMASTFLNNGAQCFIAPADYPDGNEALLFSLHFLFALLKARNPRDAFEAANQQVEGENKFQFSESDL